MKIKGIIFDIGGVLLDDPEFFEFWQNKEESKKLRNLFGTGKISKNEFISKGALMLNLDNKNFIEKYNKAYSSMNEISDVCKIYKNINIDKYIFSDTNSIHFDFCKKKFKWIFSEAKYLFLSHEIKFRKNEDSSYKYVLKNIALKPNELIFIDNNPEYIEKAKNFGINGILYKKEANLKSEILKLI